MFNITKVPELQTDHIAILTSLSSTQVMSTNPKPKYNTKKANWPLFQDILVSFDYSEVYNLLDIDKKVEKLSSCMILIPSFVIIIY